MKVPADPGLFLTSKPSMRERILPLHSAWLDLLILRMMPPPLFAEPAPSEPIRPEPRRSAFRKEGIAREWTPVD